MIPNNWSARCLSFRALQFGLRPCVTICRDVHASNATTATAPSPALESHQTNTIDIFILVIEEIMHQRSHVSGFSRSSATTECGGLAKVSCLFPNDSSKSPTSSTLEHLSTTRKSNQKIPAPFTPPSSPHSPPGSVAPSSWVVVMKWQSSPACPMFWKQSESASGIWYLLRIVF